MAVADEINTLLAREDLTDQEKRAQIRALKSQRLAEVIANLPGRTFTIGVYEVRVARIELRDGALYLWPIVTRLGQRVRVNAPLIFVNPPILVPDGGGFREDLAAAMRQMVGETLARAIL